MEDTQKHMKDFITPMQEKSIKPVFLTRNVVIDFLILFLFVTPFANFSFVKEETIPVPQNMQKHYKFWWSWMYGNAEKKKNITGRSLYLALL